jgi:alpha-tubulin suppressor-like RCC1 family protein
LGDGSTDNSATPVTVKGLTGQITAIATGVYDACALFASGRMKCWGSELGGILGNGAEAGITTAVDASVVGVNIWAVALGINHTCVLTGAGGVKCWGDNDGGQLGDGTNQRSLLPVDVTGLRSGVVAISAGGDSACALTDGGAVKCWGRNGYGQLGDGTTVDRNQPVDVRGLSSGVAAVAMNFSGACALMADGRVKCWGSNAAGKLGNGGTVDSSFPVDVLEEDNDFIDIEVGALSNCARTKAGKLKCWGFGNDGWMIPAFASCQPANVCNTPVEILSFAEPIAAITIDSFHACILTKAGAVRCWGKNTYGELGDGSTLPRSAPGVVVHL